MNTIGQFFKVLSFGESHGEYVGCVIEGCPSGLTLDSNLIQCAVDRRKTGTHSFSSSRIEADQVRIISGVFEEKTLGSPITILIQNTNTKSEDYDALKNVFRPGHADFSYQMKYGFRDHRGGGRSSIRITAPLVAAGEIANQLIQKYYPVQIKAYVSAIGQTQLTSKYKVDVNLIERSEVRCPDEECSRSMLKEIEKAKQSGDTVGGEISCIISGLPAGIGEPVFGKLQAQLASAMMNINTAKAFEYGEGAAASKQTGSEHNDVFIATESEIKPASNHHGGILGGISTGENIHFTLSLKPISSLQQEQITANDKGNPTPLSIGGRHDVCAVPRAVAIVEAYTAIVLADLILISKLNRI